MHLHRLCRCMTNDRCRLIFLRWNGRKCDVNVGGILTTPKLDKPPTTVEVFLRPERNHSIESVVTDKRKHAYHPRVIISKSPLISNLTGSLGVLRDES